MRSGALLAGISAALTLATAAVAEAPSPPRGNFGGGALVAPPRDIFAAGNAIVGLRALPKRRLEIEATVRAKCGGGDISATATIAADGGFQAKGTVKEDPDPTLEITTKYTMSGRFTAPGAAQGTISATIESSLEGAVTTCRSGTVRFAARRPTGGIGDPGAPGAARYYGTTSQRSTGPNRPIVMRISSDGRSISRALYGESTTCSDGTIAIGVDGPSLNAVVDAHGVVHDREHYTITTQDETIIHVNDRLDGQLGTRGGRGTFALSDRTADRASGRTIQSCKSGVVHWRVSR